MALACIKEAIEIPYREIKTLKYTRIPIFLGDTVSTGKTTIRVLPTAATTKNDLRTNQWYDQMIETICHPVTFFIV